VVVDGDSDGDGDGSRKVHVAVAVAVNDHVKRPHQWYWRVPLHVPVPEQT
jgi:hypothetical protein